MKLKHRHERTFHLDFGEAEGYSRIGKPPLFEIVETTQTMKNDLNSLASSFYRFVLFAESLAEYRLEKFASSLKNRISQFPNEVQQEILYAPEKIIAVDPATV